MTDHMRYWQRIPEGLRRELKLRHSDVAFRALRPRGMAAIEARANGAVDCAQCGALCFPSDTWRMCRACRDEHRVSLRELRERMSGEAAR